MSGNSERQMMDSVEAELGVKVEEYIGLIAASISKGEESGIEARLNFLENLSRMIQNVVDDGGLHQSVLKKLSELKIAEEEKEVKLREEVDMLRQSLEEKEKQYAELGKELEEIKTGKKKVDDRFLDPRATSSMQAQNPTGFAQNPNGFVDIRSRSVDGTSITALQDLKNMITSINGGAEREQLIQILKHFNFIRCNPHFANNPLMHPKPCAQCDAYRPELWEIARATSRQPQLYVRRPYDEHS